MLGRISLILLVSFSFVGVLAADENNVGLPVLEVPQDNPITKEKVLLGEKLFNDKRFSSTKTISCSTCHDPKKAFTDGPLKVSKGVFGRTGTRNSPTVLNAAFNHSQFWDGRAVNLEEQSLLPMINSVEMGLKDHAPVLEVVQTDPEYMKAFKEVFNVESKNISMKEVSKAIATFERTVIAGNSRFDRWYFLNEPTLSETEIRGYKTFIGNGRCVSCHAVEHTSALFSDNKFHNIGVGINRIPTSRLDDLAAQFLSARYNKSEVDEKVLKDPLVSDMGRFAVTREFSDMGGFKTSTLRNINLTAPYMHDGSLKTLAEVVEHYNRGGASSDKEKINPYLSGGIRPLNLTKQEKSDLVAFMKSLTSQHLVKK